MPVQAAWAGEEKTLWSCHYIRYLCDKQYVNTTPRVQISYFFTSHDHVHHVRIQWNNHPLLLFSDPQMVEALPVEHFRKQASHVTHQQHLQMGLRKGMAILIYYVVGRTHYQAVLIAEESVVNRGGKGENRLWKRVTPTVTEFAWLPPNIAESFCRNALYRVTERTYHAFDIPHLGLDTTSFVADVFVEDILYLGDTRSADDLAVFTKMAPERLCLGCVALSDEAQQYGNLDEASAIARAPRKCLVIWCGDHNQTPGGLRKTDEAKAFRRKLLRRPIALRGDTEHFQPNMLGKIVLRYLEGMDEPLINGIQAILRETMGGTCLASAEGIATLQTLCQEVGCPYHDELCFTTRCIALVVLWMALHQEKFPLLATSLQAAAGVCGRQRWALILPSSARVSLVTYTAVIAVRYPELDNVQNDLVCFGNYLLGEQATSGGFLPIFWDAPSAYMHAGPQQWGKRDGLPVLCNEGPSLFRAELLSLLYDLAI